MVRKKCVMLTVFMFFAMVIIVSSAATAPAQTTLTWEFVIIPDLPTGALLGKLWTDQPGDLYVWADRTTPGTTNVPEAFLYHWNGNSWHQVLHLPGHAPKYVFGTGPADVFASTFNSIENRPIMYHYDGCAWTEQLLPDELRGGGGVHNMAGEPGNVYASAWDPAVTLNCLILRYDGIRWRIDTPRNDWSKFGYISRNEIYRLFCWGHDLWDGTSWRQFWGFDFCDVYAVWGMRDENGILHLRAAGNNNYSNGVRVWRFKEDYPSSMTGSWGSKYGTEFSDPPGYGYAEAGSAYGIWGSAPDDIYVVGRRDGSGPTSGRVYHFDGTEWRRITDFGDIPVATWVWGSGPNNVWTVLNDGRLLHFYRSTTATVTFQADMSEMLDKSWFNPASDSIRVVGSMNGWANSESMAADPFNPSLYLYNTQITAEIGTTVYWRFRAYPNDQFLDDGWEFGANHEFEVTGQNLILAPLKPNILPGGRNLGRDVTVRFSVDVNHAIDKYNRKPFPNIKSVWATGDWNNWGGSWSVADTTVLLRMYDDGMTGGDLVKGDGIWTAEVLFAAGVVNTHLYKYAIYGAGVDTLNRGTAPMDNEAGQAQNHVVIIDDASSTYINTLDYFGSQYRNYVVFRCNMDIQIQAGNFDPANDMVVVRGGFNGWSGTNDKLMDSDGDKIYIGGVPLADSLVGTVVEYKQVLIPAGGGDVWESIANRSFTLKAGGLTLDAVYFNNVTVLPVSAKVTFQADMSEMLDKNWFDPATDSIRVIGSMNGWANSESMEAAPFNPLLYLYEANITAEVGSMVYWKFRAYPNDKFLENGWESCANHEFAFTGLNMVLNPLKPYILPGGRALGRDVTVQFSVDVNHAVDTYNHNPFPSIKSVWVTGNWNNWGGSWGVADTTLLIRMDDDGLTGGDQAKGDGIWTAEVLFAAGVVNTHLYKYAIYGAGVDTLNGGTAPMDNEAGFTQNHIVVIDDTNPTCINMLDYFGSQYRNYVVFRCNMDIQVQAGNFDPANDRVVVRGGFNGWSDSNDNLMDTDRDIIYIGGVPLADSLIGTVVEYKHVLILAGGGDIWESISNRSFTLKAGGLTLDAVYFNNVTVLPVSAKVTFQADMSEMLDKNWFDPATDSIRIVGGFNGWASNVAMEPDPFDPLLYTYDAEITEAPGAEIQWKFRAYPVDQFLDSGWEAGSNHVFVFTGADLVLDPLKPNILPGGAPLRQDVTVQFSVDVNKAVDWYNRAPFGAINSVWVTGDWNNWGGSWSVPDTIVLIRMFDNGATANNGDATAGDGIWTARVLFAAGSVTTHLYKYAIYAPGVENLNNGQSPMDNEAGFAMNHVMLIDDSNPLFVLPMDIFGSQWKTGVERIDGSTLPTEFALEQNYPNPFNAATEIVYALPKASKVTLSIYNMLGQNLVTIVQDRQTPGIYRATWNGKDQNGNLVTSGIYFYRLEADNFISIKKMLFVK